MEISPHTYTVTELTRSIRTLLEKKFPEIWVEGEISNFKLHTSGHSYFTLKDAGAELRVILYRSRRMYFAAPCELKDGMLISAHGRISVYEKSGQYQLILHGWEPKGIGSLQLAFEQMKKRLYKEGLFAEENKKPLPLFPETIGVVTSPSGAVIRDIISTTERRFPNIRIVLYPVRVQGEGAAEEIAEAINDMNKLPDIDVLIVGRGGGSLQDLWPFNEEIVARSIFDSKIPVISAVGHETDYTISDLVSDRRAPTPTAAAEIAIKKKEEFINSINFLRHKLSAAESSYINLLNTRLARAADSYVFREPENALMQYSQRVDNLIYKLGTDMNHLFEMNTGRFSSAKARLAALNPRAILKRGYSIAFNRKTGKVIRTPKGIKKGDTIETQTAGGRFISAYVQKIKQGG